MTGRSETQRTALTGSPASEMQEEGQVLLRVVSSFIHLVCISLNVTR